MPHVRKADLLNVVRELWGGTGVLEDEAKLVLAEKLISDVWENKKSGIPLNAAGIPIKAALGDRWLASGERTAAGKPSLGQVLAQDPYYVLKDVGGSHPNVKLRISRLAQLIENPQLINEYRKPAAPSSGSGGGAGSSSAAGSGRPPAPVTLTDEGLPIRPGQPVCSHYLKHGWCLFKEECWYSHPPEKGKGKRSSTPDGNMVESMLEPGVMLRDGVYPVRPGAKICGFYSKNGWCMFKARCRHHHPSQQELAAAASSNRVTTPDPQQHAPLVKQPPTQMLLGVLIDSVWHPRSSKEAFVKGQLAKHILELELGPGDITDDFKSYDVHMSQAGDYLNKWWGQQQTLYDPTVKPYRSLAEVLSADPFYRIGRTAKGAPQLTLLLGALISHGGGAAADRLSALADQVWPPNGGREVWLRGQMAKWLMTAGFRGVSKEGSSVLRQVLSVGAEGADVPTVFRIDMPAAGEYLRRCWETHDHPYDRSSTPYTQLKPLIAGDRFLYIEPAPGKPNVSHVTLDLADMLQHYPITARPAQPSSSAGGASSSSAANAGAGSSRAAEAGSSSSGGGAGDDAMELDDLDDGEAMAQALTTGDWQAYERSQGQQAGGFSGGGAGASSSSSNRNTAQPRQQNPGARATIPGGGGAAGLSPEAEVSEAEADIAALTEMVYEPPAEMQWWWPEHKAEKPECCWSEIAVRLLEPSSENFELELAEMVQHLEISSVLAMACATYKSHPHLLQFFAPYAAIGGIEMPAAVYLLDIMRPGPHIREVLELVKPVLSNPTNVKVCHGSHLWSGQLEKAFNIRLINYYDTQQANYVWHALRHEVGRTPKNMSQAGIKGTAEVSLSSLLRSFDFYHPVRHSEYKKDAPLVWQDRPLNEELITCAAADVVYLLPLMEYQVRNLRLAAGEVRQQQQQQRPGSRAAALLSSLPPELTDTNTIVMIAQGAEARGGGVSVDRIRDWSASEVFHQAPLHDAGMGLHQSYGALRGPGAVRGR